MIISEALKLLGSKLDIEKSLLSGMVLERWDTETTRINIIANKMVRRWMHIIVLRTKRAERKQLTNVEELPEWVRQPRTYYEWITRYILLCQQAQTEKSPLRTMLFQPYEWRFEEQYGLIRVRIHLSKKKDNLPVEGQTVRDEKGCLITMWLNLPWLSQVTNNSIANNSIDFDRLKYFISNFKSCLAHEVKHYFQNMRRHWEFYWHMIEQEITDKNLGMFHDIKQYFLKKSELDATMMEAYKLYKEKYIRKGGITFLDCLIIKVLRSEQTFAYKFLKGEVDLEEIWRRIPLVKKFLVLYVLFCFIPKNKKFSKLVEKDYEENPIYEEIFGDFDDAAISQNKKNLEQFLNYLQKNELLWVFNITYLGIKSNFERNVFKLKGDNKLYLNRLTGLLGQAAEAAFMGEDPTEIVKPKASGAGEKLSSDDINDFTEWTMFRMSSTSESKKY